MPILNTNDIQPHVEYKNLVDVAQVSDNLISNEAGYGGVKIAKTADGVVLFNFHWNVVDTNLLKPGTILFTVNEEYRPESIKILDANIWNNKNRFIAFIRIAPNGEAEIRYDWYDFVPTENRIVTQIWGNTCWGAKN